MTDEPTTNAMNQAILKQLKENSRITWQQLSKKVHLTGQAVSARVQQMEDKGIITGYTIRQDNLPRHFITAFMNNVDFDAFEKFLKSDERVESAHKVVGEGCYHLTFIALSDGDLEVFLDQILKYARYKVSTAIRCVK